MRFFIILSVLIACLPFSVHSQSEFDNVDWQYSKTDKNVVVYTVNDGPCNFYKAETTFVPKYGVHAVDILNALNDYDEYLEIFKKVLIFQPIGQTDEGTIIYTKADFSPMKYRVYYILLDTFVEDSTYIMHWTPYNGDIPHKPLAKNEKLVTQVSGRWIVRDNPDGSIYISNEYHNDWQYYGLTIETVRPFEENVSIKNIKLLIDYVEKKHKNL